MQLNQRLISNTRLLALVASVGLISGCVTMDRVSEDFDRARDMLTTKFEKDEPVAHVDLKPASRPTYSKGQVFIYGKSRVRRVGAIDDGLVVWANRDGEVYRTHKDFFLPRAHQEFDDRVVTRKFSGNPGALWPLAVGKRVSFIEQRSTYRKQTKTTDVKNRRWTCEVDDSRLTQVHAGEYKTYRVTCRSYRETFRNARTYAPISTIKWDYSPALGHYVRREFTQKHSGRHSVRELSAALPAYLATTKRVNAVLNRLQNNQPG